LPFVAGAVTGIAWAVYVAAINPTVGAAIVGGMTTIVQTCLMLWHDRRVDRRLRERRNVFVRGTPDDPEAVLLTGEDRRELEDRRAAPQRPARSERRHGKRRLR
jgi:hypothetical protein